MQMDTGFMLSYFLAWVLLFASSFVTLELWDAYRNERDENARLRRELRKARRN